MIPNPRQVFYPPPPHKHYRVLLEVMPLSWDIGYHFIPSGEAYLGHFA
jgi:hypothetical protein